jgi:transposase
MCAEKKQTKAAHRRYSPEFRVEALGLAEQAGVPSAAKELGLHESQLYSWRKKARYEASRSETEKQLAIENAKLKRQVATQAEELAILKKAAAYFAKSLRPLYGIPDIFNTAYNEDFLPPCRIF